MKCCLTDVITILNPIGKKKSSTTWSNYYQSKGGDFEMFDANDPKRIWSGGSPLSRRLRGRSMSNADVNRNATVEDSGVIVNQHQGPAVWGMYGEKVNHDNVTGFYADYAIADLN